MLNNDNYGALYSSFLELPYFNPITDGGIDVMHLLLNGKWLP